MRTRFFAVLFPGLLVGSVWAQTSIAGAVRQGGAGLAGVTVTASGGPVRSGANHTPVDIPDDDEAGIGSPITISGTGAVLRLEVSVDITHPFIADLRVTLRHPDGTRVILHSHAGGDADDLVTTYPTLSQPFQSLGTLTGKPAAGTWQLLVADTAFADTGRLNRWSLRVVTGSTFTSTTGAGGAYAFGNLPGGEYLVTPSRTATFFLPGSRTVATPPNATGIDFSVDPGNVTGRVTDRGSGVGGVTVTARLASAFGSRAPNLAIPDNSPAGISDSLTIGGGGAIQSLTVFVNIAHPFRGDLRVRLRHPDGTEVLLHARTGDFEDDLIVAYPDEAAPEESLAVLDGKPLNGTWRLIVADEASPDAGTLVSWGLGFFTPGGPVFTTTTAPDGTYALNNLGPAAFRLTPSLGAYTFIPSVRARFMPPSAAGMDFAIPAPRLASFTSPMVAMTAGQSQEATIGLTGPAGPAGPLTVSVLNSDAGALTAPSSVTFPPGAATATLTLSAPAVTATRPANLVAAFGDSIVAMTVINGPPGRLHWYGGDFDGREAVRSEQNTENGEARLYDGFSLPFAAEVRSVFGFFAVAGDFTPAQARIQIRQGTAPNQEGALLYDAVRPVASTWTHYRFLGLDVAVLVADGLSVELPAGEYHLTMAPVGDGAGGFFVCTTSGARGLGSPLADGRSFLSWPGQLGGPPLVAEPVESTAVLGPGVWDFQFGAGFVLSAPMVSGVISFTSLAPHATRPSTVVMEFRHPGTTTVVASVTVGVAPDGSFSVVAPGAGVYDLAFKHGQWLRSIRRVDATAGDVPGVAFDLISGDVNRDNAVDLQDFLILASTYEVSPPAAPEADLNGDGAVDLEDFLILAASYDTIGPD
jgi:subtilisin-like proprotein convertase family protein